MGEEIADTVYSCAEFLLMGLSCILESDNCRGLSICPLHFYLCDIHDIIFLNTDLGAISIFSKGFLMIDL